MRVVVFPASQAIQFFFPLHRCRTAATQASSSPSSAVCQVLTRSATGSLTSALAGYQGQRDRCSVERAPCTLKEQFQIGAGILFSAIIIGV